MDGRRKFRSLTSDNMQSWKSRVEMSSQQKEDQHACRVTRKKVHVRKMLGTSRIAVFSQWFVVPDVRKVASLKRRVRRYLFSRQVKNGTPLWRKAHLQVKMHKTPHSRSHFGSCDVQKWHAAVAKSTFGSENAKKLTVSGAILDVPMLQNGTRLWREAYFEVKMLKNWRVRTTFWRFDVEKSHAAVARSTFASQNVQNTCVLQHFERFLTD